MSIYIYVKNLLNLVIGKYLSISIFKGFVLAFVSTYDISDEHRIASLPQLSNKKRFDQGCMGTVCNKIYYFVFILRYGVHTRYILVAYVTQIQCSFI